LRIEGRKGFGIYGRRWQQRRKRDLVMSTRIRGNVVRHFPRNWRTSKWGLVTRVSGWEVYGLMVCNRLDHSPSHAGILLCGSYGWNVSRRRRRR
jgi:hypothetical protein